MQKVKIATWSQVPDRTPVGALVGNFDLVVVRFDDNHSVLYGRCLHRGALMSDGCVTGDNLICGLYGWDYLFHTGVSSYNNAEQLAKFSSWLEGDDLCVDQDELETWEKAHPQPYDRAAYQGAYQDPHGDSAEPHVGLVRRLANEGLEYLGHHGPVTSMGVSREQLPKWDDIQFVTGQLARKPQLDAVPVATEVVIGPNADRPLTLDIPLFVSDMSYGALSEEAKVALARGAELAGTGICSGEGGMLLEEHVENSRYFYELASGKFGWELDKVAEVQAFHFKLARGPRPPPEGIFPAPRFKERSRRCVGSRRARTRFPRRRFKTWRTKTTSTPRCGSVSTTLFSTAVAGGRARPRSCFVTTFRCRPFPRWIEPGDISTPGAVATSRS